MKKNLPHVKLKEVIGPSLLALIVSTIGFLYFSITNYSIFLTRDLYRASQYFASKENGMGPEISYGGRVLGDFYYFMLNLFKGEGYPFESAWLLMLGLFFLALLFQYFYFYKKTGSLSFAIFCALIPLLFQSTHDQILKLWNPSFLPLFAVGSLILLDSFQKIRKPLLYGGLAGIIHSLAIQLHYQALVLFFAFVLGILLLSRKEKLKSLSLFLLLFLLTYMFFIDLGRVDIWGDNLTKSGSLSNFFVIQGESLKTFYETLLRSDRAQEELLRSSLMLILLFSLIIAGVKRYLKSKDSKALIYSLLFLFYQFVIIVSCIQGDGVSRYYSLLGFIVAFQISDLYRESWGEWKALVYLPVLTVVSVTVLIGMNSKPDLSRGYSSLGYSQLREISEKVSELSSCSGSEEIYLLGFNSTDTFQLLFAEDLLKKRVCKDQFILVNLNRPGLSKLNEFDQLLKFKGIPASLKRNINTGNLKLKRRTKVSDVAIYLLENSSESAFFSYSNAGFGYLVPQIEKSGDIVSLSTLDLCDSKDFKEVCQLKIFSQDLGAFRRIYLFNAFVGQRGEWVTPSKNLYLKDLEIIVKCEDVIKKSTLESLGFPNPLENSSLAYVTGPIQIYISDGCRGPSLSLSWAKGGIFSWKRTTNIRGLNNELLAIEASSIDNILLFPTEK